MDHEDNNFRRNDSVYSRKVRAGKRRTYFFDVRQTKGEDYYLTLTESTRRFDGDGYDRHKIFLYKEDFNRFLGNLEDAIDHVKHELMPDYDYDEFTRRHEEWEENDRLEKANASSESNGSSESSGSQEIQEEKHQDDPPQKENRNSDDDNMSW